MHLNSITYGTKVFFYKNPAMIMSTSAGRGGVEHLDYDILEQFTTNSLSEAIIIDGLEEGRVMIEARAFIFTARKRFDPGMRPLIIVYTKYTIDQLRSKSFTGLECEMLQYGNCILIARRSSEVDQKKIFRKFGIFDLLRNHMEIHEYTGHQYE